MSETAALVFANVTKTFNGVRVLDGVSLTVRAGTVHGLIGHNGSGKSTLIKVLAGFHQPDEPTVGAAFGNSLDLGSHRSAHAAGLRFVHQDLGLVDRLNTVDNLALGTGYPTRGGITIDWPEACARSRSVISSLGFTFDVRRPVGELSAAQRTGVAIARALQEWSGRRAVVVLDEPTAAMPAHEAAILFEAVRRLSSQGLGVLYVTHHLNEVLDLADDVTVLRNGRVIQSRRADGLSHRELVTLIVGETHGSNAVNRTDRTSELGPVVLEAEQLGAGVLADFDLRLRAGEIVGVAGVDGSGRESVAPALSGNLSRSGRLEVLARTIPAGRPRESIRAGMGYVPADRLRNGVVPALDVSSNLTLADLVSVRRFGLLNARAQATDSQIWMNNVAVDKSKATAPILTLSGGNQQKVMVGRWLRRQPAVLLLDEPTQGVDVGASALIYDLVRRAAGSGCGVIVCSSDTEELVSLCDRVIVVTHGRQAGELTGADLNVEAIDTLALSQKPGARA